MLTDRDERVLLAAAENRIARPLRIGAALAAVRRTLARRTLARRSPDRAQQRESVTCQPTTTHSPVHP
ncbi:hypothetical protein ACFCXH_05845 [Streptomyces nojiriensis]|uniref:hypothetical protein n=1 Tax=Streptomyces nojiriensis TaxID=66374 RepID=UPI0035DC10B1